MPVLFIYGQQHEAEAAALADGARAVGFTAKFRNPHVYRADQFEKEPDVVITIGLRNSNKIINQQYTDYGTPALVLDLCYMRRDYELRQLGIGKIGWVTDRECPPDRFDALDIDIKPIVDRDGYTLILGQLENDAQHGLAGEQLADLYTQWAKEAGGEVVYRPHPKAHPKFWGMVQGVTLSEPTKQSLKACLNGAAKVVTYNSTGGLDAILQGVPAEAKGWARWAELGTNPTVEAVRAFCGRLAYSQWSIAEIASGEALAFILGETGMLPRVELKKEVKNARTRGTGASKAKKKRRKAA